MRFGIFLLFAYAGLAGCSLFNKDIVGSGKIASEVRPAQNFTSVVLTGQANLLIIQGDNETLKIEADDNLLPYIKSGVSNGVLRIEENSNPLTQIIKPSKPITIFLTVKNIEEIILAGNGQITSESKLKGKTLTVNVSGAGKVDLDLGFEKFTADISGSAEYSVKGSADDQEVHISGAGLYDAPDLISKRVTVNISGYGKATVNAEDTLDIIISGNGSVFYTGSPKVTQKVQGNAKIEQIK